MANVGDVVACPAQVKEHEYAWDEGYPFAKLAPGDVGLVVEVYTSLSVLLMLRRRTRLVVFSSWLEIWEVLDEKG